MSRFEEPLKFVKLPELVASLGFAALSVPCYQAARDERELAENIRDTHPGQSAYIQSNAKFPEGLGNTFAGTAAVVFPLSFRLPRRRDEKR